MSGIFNLLFPEPDTYKPLKKAIDNAAKEYNVFPAKFTDEEKLAVTAMDEFLHSIWDQIRANPSAFQDAINEHAIAENSPNGYALRGNNNNSYNDPYNRGRYTYFDPRRGSPGVNVGRMRKSRKAQKGPKKGKKSKTGRRRHTVRRF